MRFMWHCGLCRRILSRPSTPCTFNSGTASSYTGPYPLHCKARKLSTSSYPSIGLRQPATLDVFYHSLCGTYVKARSPKVRMLPKSRRPHKNPQTHCWPLALKTPKAQHLKTSKPKNIGPPSYYLVHLLFCIIAITSI